MEMNKSSLLDICKQHNLYRTPHLNDKLYANFRGFSSIACLEPYTGLRALFLEGNALESLEGLPKLDQLRCLYVQQNRIKIISSLENAPDLNTLNISNNELQSLDGLQICDMLETLICTHNQLCDAQSIKTLLEVPTLQTVDLQNNKLDDAEVVDVLKQMPNLRCLYLKGNPVVSRVKNYRWEQLASLHMKLALSHLPAVRKTLISAIPSLTYLDDRPVFENEREIVEGWARAGLEGERTAREAIKQREKERDRRNFEYMQAIRAEAFRQKRERLGLPEGDTDPDLDAFSDTEWEAPEDPPELVEARKRLERYQAQNAEGAEASNVRDGEDYLQSIRDNAQDMGDRASVSGLCLHDSTAEVVHPSAQLRAATFAAASAIKGSIPSANCVDGDVMPPLESIPTHSIGVGAGLNELD